MLLRFISHRLITSPAFLCFPTITYLPYFEGFADTVPHKHHARWQYGSVRYRIGGKSILM